MTDLPAGLSIEQTLVRVIRYCGRAPRSTRARTEPRWAIVSDFTLHGSTYSIALCRWAGCDPDEQLVRR